LGLLFTFDQGRKKQRREEGSLLAKKCAVKCRWTSGRGTPSSELVYRTAAPIAIGWAIFPSSFCGSKVNRYCSFAYSALACL
jgi:hypothetical protein